MRYSVTISAPLAYGLPVAVRYGVAAAVPLTYSLPMNFGNSVPITIALEYCCYIWTATCRKVDVVFSVQDNDYFIVFGSDC